MQYITRALTVPIPNSGNQMSYFYSCKFGNMRNHFYFFLSVGNLSSQIMELQKQRWDYIKLFCFFFSPRYLYYILKLNFGYHQIHQWHRWINLPQDKILKVRILLLGSSGGGGAITYMFLQILSLTHIK